jgi:hypothetical protein
VARRAEFLRTPKVEEHGGIIRSITANLPETAFALAGIGGIACALTHAGSPAGPLTAVLLLLPTWSFLSAPLNSMAARRAALSGPPEPDESEPLAPSRSGQER